MSRWHRGHPRASQSDLRYKGDLLHFLELMRTIIYQKTSCDFNLFFANEPFESCLLYTSPSPRDRQKSRMPSSA